MELLSLLGAATGATVTVMILSVCAGTAMNSGMNRVLLWAGAYGFVVGAIVGWLVACLGVPLLYWLVVPVSAASPAVLYLLVAFASVTIKAHLEKARFTATA